MIVGIWHSVFLLQRAPSLFRPSIHLLTFVVRLIEVDLMPFWQDQVIIRQRLRDVLRMKRSLVRLLPIGKLGA